MQLHITDKPTPRLLLIAALIMVSALLTVAPRANSGAAMNAITPPTGPLKSLYSAVSASADPRVVAGPLNPPQTTAIGSVLVTMRQNGFEPSVITRQAGAVFLVVQNRSGFQNAQLRLDRTGGAQLYNVFVPRSQLDWVQVINLQPGGYTLTDAYHEDWACKIEVTN